MSFTAKSVLEFVAYPDLYARFNFPQAKGRVGKCARRRRMAVKCRELTCRDIRGEATSFAGPPIGTGAMACPIPICNRRSTSSLS